MKNNFILSAIGLITIVGAALAFKSQHRFNGTLFCYTTIGDSSKFTAVLATKYSQNVFSGHTLFCTVPGINVAYKQLQVEPKL
ncbi:hypothetical protein [Chitinophaga sancti]|uniref:Uncharacterized protein n=1 Tax=Chitinophaga sancti TaxID=1004 RepID=A0A1K1T2X3_9BACT|nr:hypothetical protein [Chitinophaga sancti]WQD59632.1 hypothetical protein U0033_17230 [Chitinophaga sancti]WQG88237.1 hypothetical protein SR876_25235 [Chitinophaga sancti]SFW90852.1 hypothetical protein SAMN05661012_06687 [Chitinophaga sancti]